MPDRTDTTIRRPLPQRPRLGWVAWVSTMGYISAQHSPDALLKLQVEPADSGVRWAGAVSWGQVEESVRDRQTIASVLRDLWLEVDQNHRLFKTIDAAIKRPADYKDDEWLDERTLTLLDRLIRVTHTVFKDNWQILIVYQPIENPETRVQTRLIARDNTVIVGGRGSSLGDACADLYHHAARVYAIYRLQD